MLGNMFSVRGEAFSGMAELSLHSLREYGSGLIDGETF
jgi:hypothetical protein